MSVVIPTLDAGPDFARCLSLLRAQQGLGKVELIVADSGSTDDTCAVAEAAGARLVNIPPGQFNHGGTRNRAAELASFDTLLMTVQDATLLTRTGVRDLLLALHRDPRTAAVSARQVPRSSSDLFGAYVTWSHHRAIWQEARHNFSRNGRPPTAVDDVCAVIRRSAWDQVRFSEVDFAEDLDFGLRALEQGWRIEVCPSVAVAHSHRRDACYHLRRSVADRLYVAPMVADDVLSLTAERPLPQVVAAGRALVTEVEGALWRVTEDDDPDPLARQFEAVETGIGPGSELRSPTGQLAPVVGLLEEHGAGSAPEGTVEMLRRDLFNVLRWQPLRSFVSANRAAAPREGADFFAKLTASVVGRAVGDALRVGGDRSAARRFLKGV